MCAYICETPGRKQSGQRRPSSACSQWKTSTVKRKKRPVRTIVEGEVSEIKKG